MTATPLPCSWVVSLLLLDAEAAKVSIRDPFKLTSGAFSPLYFDCRRLLLSHAGMRLVADLIAHWIEANAIKVDVVAGGESAGIPFAAYLACVIAKPMVYVRKAAKQHGTAAQVEGGRIPQARALLVEDLITDGASKVSFIEGLRAAEFLVEDCCVVLDREQGGADLLAQHGVRLWSLTTAKATLSCAVERGVIGRGDYDSAMAYIEDPARWNEERQRDGRES